jgi:hypothetical protein
MWTVGDKTSKALNYLWTKYQAIAASTLNAQEIKFLASNLAAMTSNADLITTASLDSALQLLNYVWASSTPHH